MSNKPVEVGIARPLNIQVSSADVIDGLIVEGTVTVINGGVDTVGGFVGLDYCGGHQGSVVDAEIQLGVLALVDGESFLIQ